MQKANAKKTTFFLLHCVNKFTEHAVFFKIQPLIIYNIFMPKMRKKYLKYFK